jgi:hypothetical protein
MDKYLAALKKKFPYAYSLVPQEMWVWIYNNCLKQEGKKLDYKLEYKNWCKATKRNGGVLVGPSIGEFIDHLSTLNHGQ